MPEPISEPIAPAPTPDPQRGVALIMVVIFSILLVVLITELVTTARQAAATSDNDVTLALMSNQMERIYPEVLQQLADDLTAGAEEGGEGALPTGGPGGLPTGGPTPGGEGGEGEEETPPSDSFNDAYLKPQAFADGDLTTYVYVEDENRKFNILTLMSPDEEFARESRERLVRLLRAMREDAPGFEISASRAESIATAILSWLRGEDRNDVYRPQPKLKSDDPQEPRRTIPLHLEELLLLREIDRLVFDDQIYSSGPGSPLQVLPGLASVLTIYTSYKSDPGDPEKRARNNQNAGNNQNANPQGSNNPAGEGEAAATANKTEGIGIRINVNTAHRCVLRSLFPVGQIPDTVIDAIIDYRNEEMPEEEGAEEEIDAPFSLDEGVDIPKQIFNSLEDLEKVPEFANLADREVKEKFLNLLTTESDVFTIHMACLFKRSEERKIFVLNRRRSVVVRLEGNEQPRLHPILRMERYHGRRVHQEDVLESVTDRDIAMAEMDEFSQEERKWNPFYKDFYRYILDKQNQNARR